MNDTILITGGSGLLALNWALTMREKYPIILGLHSRNIQLSGVKTQLLPLEPFSELLKVLEKTTPGLIIHTAGMTNVEECEANPDKARHINVTLAENVARACGELKIRLVHISTDHLFSGEIPLCDENQKVSPVNVYARTKAEAELRVRDRKDDALIIRTNFFGWGPIYRRSFSDWIIDNLKLEKSLTLFTDVFYTPILIEALVLAVHDLVTIGASGVFHVVGDERISKYQFGLRLADFFGLDKKLISEGGEAAHRSFVPRPRDLSLSNKKACTVLERTLGNIDMYLYRLFQQRNNVESELIDCWKQHVLLP